MVLLRQYREKRHMTQVELSQKSGVPQATISSIENGSRKGPGVDTLYAICVALKCSLDDIYIPDEEKTN